MKLLNKLFYHSFLILYRLGISLAGLWSPKARKWVKGRIHFPSWSPSAPVVWMHCSSLGEFEQGRPLLEHIRRKYPNYQIALSFFSPSGYEIRKNFEGADYVFYLPTDNPIHARRLQKLINPHLVLWVKYEYWYYFLRRIYKKQIPLLMVSGIYRPAQPFFKWYGGFWREMLGFFSHLFIQNEESAALLNTLDISNYTLAGDTRFDRVIEIANASKSYPVVEEFISGRRTIVAGSTWREDEMVLFHFIRSHPEIAFVVVPHEVSADRINEIMKELPDARRYSEIGEGDQVDSSAHVLIIDNIGMLSSLYRYADICFVGGGFTPNGVHNVLEAAVYDRPVLFGPEHQKFQETRDLINAGGGFSPSGPLELEKMLTHLLNDDLKLNQAGKCAGDYVRSKQGATELIMDYIQRNRLLTN